MKRCGVLRKAGGRIASARSRADLTLSLGPSQALQDKYLGWEGRETAEAFERYCRILFERLGKKVTYWVTMNEQNVFTSLGTVGHIHQA